MARAIAGAAALRGIVGFDAADFRARRMASTRRGCAMKRTSKRTSLGVVAGSNRPRRLA
jgi:hypothetical protein